MQQLLRDSTFTGIFVVTLATATLSTAQGLQTADGNARAGAAAAATNAQPYRIGPEDVLDISVWNNDKVSAVGPVSPDAKILLPLIDDLQAAGLTPVELRDEINRRLVEFIPTPSVSVIVREVHSFKVSVSGAVKMPGRFELRSKATVLDVIALAGGFAEFADKSRIVILRQDGPNTRRYVFNYNKVVSGDEPSNAALQPGDVIVVP